MPINHLWGEDVVFEELLVSGVQLGIGDWCVGLGVDEVDGDAQVVFCQHLVFVVLLKRRLFVSHVSDININTCMYS